MGKHFGYKVAPHTNSLAAYAKVIFRVDIQAMVEKHSSFVKTDRCSVAWNQKKMFGITKIGVLSSGSLKFQGAKS